MTKRVDRLTRSWNSAGPVASGLVPATDREAIRREAAQRTPEAPNDARELEHVLLLHYEHLLDLSAAALALAAAGSLALTRTAGDTPRLVAAVEGAALGGAPALETLVVGKNAFGAAAAEGLKAACKARGVAAMAGYFDAL